MKPKRKPSFTPEEYCPQSGKVLFRTKQKAYKAAMSIKGPKGREANVVYKCKYCKFYHLAHRKNSETGGGFYEVF